MEAPTFELHEKPHFFLTFSQNLLKLQYRNWRTLLGSSGKITFKSLQQLV
jgi:hypothetical protein